MWNAFFPLIIGFNLCLLFQNYIARFGHGSAKLARQAQSKEKTLAKVSWALTIFNHILLLGGTKRLKDSSV
jgi:hypothetical protein